MMEYQFRLSFHSDLCFQSESGQILNLGYHNNHNLPPLIWLYWHQLERGNVFEHNQLWDFKESDDPEIIETVERSLEARSRLPIRQDIEKEFFLVTYWTATYHSGNNRDSYLFILREQELALVEGAHPESDRKLMSLDLLQSKKFIDDYLEFVKKENKLGITRDKIATVVKRLKEN